MVVGVRNLALGLFLLDASDVCGEFTFESPGTEVGSAVVGTVAIIGEIDPPPLEEDDGDEDGDAPADVGRQSVLTLQFVQSKLIT
jgi:hypothetical protein